MTMNPLQCDIQLRGCQHGHMLLEHPKTMWPVAEDIVRSPDVSAWKSAVLRRPSVSGRLPRAKRGRHHEDRHGCPPWRTRCSPTIGWVCSRGQRIAGVARRPVVVVRSLRGRGLASLFSGLQDAPSACQQVQRVLPFGGLPGRGRA